MNSNRILVIVALVITVLASAGCLETRSGQKEQEEKQVLKKTVQTLQQSTADVNTRFQDLEDDVRRINGRLEAVDNRFNQFNAKTDKTDASLEMKIKESSDKIVAYREEITRLNIEVTDLRTQVAALVEEQRRVLQAQADKAAAAAKDREKGSYALAEEKFEQKNWKEAILDYEKYRKANPKGKQFAMATYKIGVSFQELGLIDEAKAFYEEVVSKFPKSKEADKASTRLKGLNKKK